MDQIEIIVTKPDTATPSTSSTALDKISDGKSTPSSPQSIKSLPNTTSTVTTKPQLALQYSSKNCISNTSPTLSENHLNRTRHHPHHHHHHHSKPSFKHQSVIIEHNNEKEGEDYIEEDESKTLLLASSSSSASLQLSPSKKASIVPSASTSHLRLKSNYKQLDNSSLSGTTTSAEPSSTTSPIGSPLPVNFTIGSRPKQYHSMRSVRSGELVYLYFFFA